MSLESTDEYVTLTTTAKAFAPTMRLREVGYPGEPGRIQQLWICPNTGEASWQYIEWHDIRTAALEGISHNNGVNSE